MEIVGANFEVTDKETGKPLFQMKRKDNANYGGAGLYYIFKIHEENFPDEETRDRFMNEGFSGMKMIASVMGIPLFSIDEMGERVQAKMKEIMGSGVDLDKKQYDVEIELMNYATEELQHLTIGISTKPRSEME